MKPSTPTLAWETSVYLYKLGDLIKNMSISSKRSSGIFEDYNDILFIITPND